MTVKLYSKAIKFIKENYKSLIFICIINIFLTFPIPYYIHSTGGIIDISDKLNIEGNYESKGSFNLSYVTEIKGNVLTYLFSFVIKDWDLIKKDEIKASNETIEEYSYRNSLFLKEANQNAILVAYNYLNMTPKIDDNHIYVVFISEESNTNIKIKDEIISVDGRSISSLNEYKDIIQTYNNGDIVNLIVKNAKGNKEKRYIEISEYDNRKITGIYIINDKTITTTPKVSFNFEPSESGPSGGLMMSLSIYDKLTEDDITKGKKIVGTGTIDEYGDVGAIGGIKYKIRAAVKSKADLFLVPSRNYDDAKKELDKHNTNMKIISVKTFNDAIDYLNNN